MGDTDQEPRGTPGAGRDGAEPRPELRALLADMRLTLLSEIGARSATDHLRRRARDPDLVALLTQVNQEGAEVVTRLQALMRGLGDRPRETSLRRRVLARVLVLGSRVVGLRPVLRIVQQAAETVSRWYGEYAVYLARLGDTERAREFEALQRTKLLHARALGAWVSNMARRAR